MEGKVVVITGANTGIGKETAKELARRGAEVHLLCRDMAKAEVARGEIWAETGKEVHLHHLDLSSLASVRSTAHLLLSSLARLDVLVNNAGVMATPEWRTVEGHEMQLATNHLGHFLLTDLLLPLLRTSQARVVVLSSLAHQSGRLDWQDLHFHTRPYDPMEAYSQSKLANILFAKELARREPELSVYAVHPGIVKTELSRSMLESLGPVKFVLIKLFFPFLKTAVSGAQTSLHLSLTDPSLLLSGAYYADCALSQTAPQADSVEDARRLWQLSQAMVATAQSGG